METESHSDIYRRGGRLVTLVYTGVAILSLYNLLLFRLVFVVKTLDTEKTFVLVK